MGTPIYPPYTGLKEQVSATLYLLYNNPNIEVDEGSILHAFRWLLGYDENRLYDAWTERLFPMIVINSDRLTNTMELPRTIENIYNTMVVPATIKPPRGMRTWAQFKNGMLALRDAVMRGFPNGDDLNNAEVHDFVLSDDSTPEPSPNFFDMNAISLRAEPESLDVESVWENPFGSSYLGASDDIVMSDAKKTSTTQETPLVFL